MLCNTPRLEEYEKQSYIQQLLAVIDVIKDYYYLIQYNKYILYSNSPCPSNITILVMGLTYSLVEVFTRTDRTKPSELLNTFLTRARGQRLLGADSSSTRTRSPIAKFILAFCHFTRFYKSGR